MKITGITVILLYMLTEATLASQHILNYKAEPNSISILKELNYKVNNAKSGDLIQIVVQNRREIKNDLQLWLYYAGHNVLSMQEDENFVHVQLIKNQYVKTNPPQRFELYKTNSNDTEQIIENAWSMLIKGYEVHLYFNGDAAQLLTSNQDTCQKNTWLKRKSTSSLSTLSTPDKLKFLNSLGAKLHVKQQLLIKHKINSNQLILDNIIIEQL